MTITILMGTVTHGLHAKDLAFCSKYGDPGRTSEIDVRTRVNSVQSGRIAAGPAILLRDRPEEPCGRNERCSVTGTFPLQAGTNGVELGRNQSWICVAVPGKRPLEVLSGWIPEKRWQKTESGQVKKRWLGVWQNEHAKIRIQQSEAQQLSVTGNALWIGGAMETFRFGAFEMLSQPDHDVLATAPSTDANECHVALRLVGSFMFGADNGNCGAMNVTFDGLYRYRPGRK